MDQRAGQGHALALAAGELRGFAVAIAGQGDHPEGLLGAGQPFGLGHAFHLQAVGDVVAHVHVREQGVVLEHGVHIPFIRRQAGGFLPMDTDGARGGLLETGDQAQAGGLA
ncbi:hypothetical protein D3C85_897660 [compost metagenome]